MKKSTKAILICVSTLLIAAIGFFGFQSRYYPHYISQRREFDITQTPVSDGEINVMSFNVRRSNILEPGKRDWYWRADLMIDTIGNNAPDIIGFQEVKRLQYRYFQKTLPGYESVTEYRDSSFDPESCPIFFRADKYALIGSGTFWLSETPGMMSKGWDGDCYRLCTWVVLTEKSTGRELAVYNTHLDNAGQQARQEGMKLILERIAQRGDMPVILTGDMNSGEDSAVYGLMTGALLDTKTEAEDTMDVKTSNSFGNDGGHIIDYIMVSKTGFEAEKYWVDRDAPGGVFVSDHYAVCARVKL